METTERTAPETPPRQRRVGTFTLGVTLVAAGTLMLASMLFPRLDLRWALKCSPVILICLGVETLIAARGGGRIRYDWAGMLLCFVLTGAALCMCAAAWYVSCRPEYGRCEGAVAGDESGFSIGYGATGSRQLRLPEAALDRGSLRPEAIRDDSREAARRDEKLSEGSPSFGVEKSGACGVWAAGEQSSINIRGSSGPV